MNLYLQPVKKQAPLRGVQFRRSLRLDARYDDRWYGGESRRARRVPRDPNARGGRRLEVCRLSRVGWRPDLNENRPAPNVTDARPAWSPFLSISVDWDVKGPSRRCWELAHDFVNPDATTGERGGRSLRRFRTTSRSVSGRGGTKPTARGGARYTLQDDVDVWFQPADCLFKRVFLPEFTLTNISQPVEPTFRIVSKVEPPDILD